MLLSIIFLYVLSNFMFIASSEIGLESSLFDNTNAASNSPITALIKKVQSQSQNATFFDKEMNQLRLPNISKNFEEQKSKRKTIKKSPRRTIQKIIKKNKGKRKIHLYLSTNIPTRPPNDFQHENKYVQEDLPHKVNIMSTTQESLMRKQRKWNSKIPRYQRPYQKLPSNAISKRDKYIRTKRSEERDDAFILTDLDEIEFVSRKKGYNVINAHLRKPW